MKLNERPKLFSREVKQNYIWNKSRQPVPLLTSTPTPTRHEHPSSRAPCWLNTTFSVQRYLYNENENKDVSRRYLAFSSLINQINTVYQISLFFFSKVSNTVIIIIYRKNQIF